MREESANVRFVLAASPSRSPSLEPYYPRVQGGLWWDGFFSNRAKPCPFFVKTPDENLSEWVLGGRIPPGRALELGCGNGRNSLFLSRMGFEVRAVDFSERAIDWARELAAEANLAVTFECASIFDADIEEGAYDLVYDSGCYHHIHPRDRVAYVELVRRALKPAGQFGLVCFRPEGGSGLTDEQVFENDSLGGGLGYTEGRLRQIFGSANFEIEVLRQMVNTNESDELFGEDFLWALLATKRTSEPPR